MTLLTVFIGFVSVERRIEMIKEIRICILDLENDYYLFLTDPVKTE